MPYKDKKKCVYKIVCKDKEITEFYIGSSIYFDRRKYEHKCDSNNLNSSHYCLPLYMFINVNGGFENWEIVLIKEYKFITKKELEMNEQYYIELLKPNLNSKSAKSIKTKKDYDKEHNNKKANCPHCGKEMNSKNIKRHIKSQHNIV